MSERLEDEIGYLSSKALYKSMYLYLYLIHVPLLFIWRISSAVFYSIVNKLAALTGNNRGIMPLNSPGGSTRNGMRGEFSVPDA